MAKNAISRQYSLKESSDDFGHLTFFVEFVLIVVLKFIVELYLQQYWQKDNRKLRFQRETKFLILRILEAIVDKKKHEVVMDKPVI